MMGQLGLAGRRIECRRHIAILWGLFVALRSLFGTAEAADAKQPMLWLTTMEPVWRDILSWPPSDYARLGQDGAAWSNVLRRLAVFQFTERYAVHGDLEEIKALIALLHANHVDIALQGIPLVATTRCGLGVESFGTKEETLVGAKRLQSAGANLKYIVFDEPLYYGHFFHGGRTTVGCQLPLSDLLAQIAEREQALRASIPGVAIGDVEPFGLADVATNDWTAAYQEWLTAYRERNGHNWDFVQADVVWNRSNWREQFLPAVKAIQDSGTPWGVMYTAAARASSNSDWASQVNRDYHWLEGEMGIHPPQIVIAAWTDYPRANLPETDSNTLTGVALDYLKYHDKTSK
jgi:hypothetical protein